MSEIARHKNITLFTESEVTHIVKRSETDFVAQITKKPRFDITKLMEVHGDTGVEEVGASLTTDREEGETALEGAGGRL